jgi:hypothetical protein
MKQAGRNQTVSPLLLGKNVQRHMKLLEEEEHTCCRQLAVPP